MNTNVTKPAKVAIIVDDAANLQLRVPLDPWPETRVRIPLGTSDDVFDGGNQQDILPDRSLVFGSKVGLGRVRPLSP